MVEILYSECYTRSQNRDSIRYLYVSEDTLYISSTFRRTNSIFILLEERDAYG